uniref:BACON domain-containing protein n=1 Tax=uncultured Draconibacterium sp. TaxID=1573823 RepID=UPI0032169C29
MQKKQKPYFNYSKATSAIIIIFFGIWLNSCSNSFLDDTQVPNGSISNDTLFLTSLTQSFTIDIDMQQSNSAWRLFQYPQWLTINPRFGQTGSNTKVSFTCSVDHSRINNGYGLYTYPLVLDIDGQGLVQHTVAYFDFGDPMIEVFPESLNLESILHGEISISNNRNGLLMWEITKTPEWLSFETTSGSYPPYSIYQIKYTADITGLQAGEYHDEVIITNNANGELRFPVSLKVSPLLGNGTYQQGELIDSKFLKTTNQLITLTKNPNRLLYFTPGETEPLTIQLDRVPRCMALSENEQLLAIGYTTAEVSTYSPTSGDKKNTLTLNDVPEAMEFGSESFVYFLSGSGYKYVNSVNLNTGEILTSSSTQGGIVELEKIPNKDILVTTRSGWSPDYLIFYFRTNTGAVDSLNEYSMPANGFWISEDGERIFCGTNKIYSVPDYIPNKPWSYNEHPPVVGEYETTQYHTIYSMAFQNEAERLYVASGEHYSFSPRTYITSYHLNTYVPQKTYDFSSIPPADHSPHNSWGETTEDIYALSDNSALWIVQTYPPADYNQPNRWGVRLLELDD